MLFNRPRYNLYQTVSFRQFINEDDVFEGHGIVLTFGFVMVKERYEIEYVIDVNGKRYSILESEIEFSLLGV